MTLADLIRNLRVELDSMTTDAARIETIECILEGYCQHCGAKLSPQYRRCHCTNDE